MSAELVQFPQYPPAQYAHPQHGYGQYGPMSNDALLTVYEQALRGARASDVTVQNRMWLLQRLAKFLAPTLLIEARYPQLLAWQSSLSALSAGTVAGYVASLRVFYRWCVWPMRLLEVSPAEELVIPRQQPGKPRPVPENHLQIAIACTPDPQMRAWLYLGAYAGLRCMEIATLQRAWVIEGDMPRLHIIGKGRRERIVYIGPQILSVLEPFMHRTGHLFLNNLGRPFAAKWVTDKISRHFKSLSLPYTAHQLRHRYGTRALALTKNVRVVQEQMGHSSPATTQLYTLVNEEETVELAKALDAEVRDTRRH